MKQYNIKGIVVVLNIITGEMQLNAQGCRPPSTKDLHLCLFCHLFASANKNCSANELDRQLSVKSRHFQFIFKENPCSPAAGNNNLCRLLYLKTQCHAVGPVMFNYLRQPAAQPCQVSVQRRWDMV